MRGWRRVVHFLTRWPFFARSPIAVWTEDRRIFTHPKNLDDVRAWLEARGVPYRVNALAPVRDLTAEPRT